MPIPRICHSFVLLFCLWPLTSNAQELVKTNRVGFVSANTQTAAAEFLDALRKGLRDLGYEENKNLEIEQRYADGLLERLPGLVDELVKANVSVIVTSSIPSALAAKKVTASIPIVVAAAGDFVGNGLAVTLEHPGGNITGIDELVPGLSARRLELLNEAVAVKSAVAILSSATGPTHAKQMEDSERAASALGVTLKTFKIQDAKEIDAAFDSIAQAQASALLVFSGVLTGIHSKRIVELAAKSRLPSMYWQIRFVNDGGLMYYGPNLPHMFEQSAVLVDRILKGANAADLPVEYAKEFELVINLKAAKELSITVPQAMIARASRVIQ
jgi:putative tryptophan/tyrosine transport system substrate-binding protein